MQGRTSTGTADASASNDDRSARYSTHQSYANAAHCTHTYAHASDAASDAAEVAYESMLDLFGYQATTVAGTDLIGLPHALTYAVLDDYQGEPYIDLHDRETFTAKLSAHIMQQMHADGIWVATIGKAYVRAIDHAQDGAA